MAAVAAGFALASMSFFGGASAAHATDNSPARDVYAFGNAQYYGSPSGMALHAPIVGMARTNDGKGYVLLGRDGGVFTYGTAKFYGSTGNLALRQPVVGMAATPSGKGYWFVASDGGIFSYGDAHFYGSTGNIALRQPVVGMAATPSGKGYWLIASDGGIFSFGDAHFFGSTGNIALRQPIVSMTATRSGRGYWLAASDGGIFAFGNARFHGSTGNIALRQPIVGMTTTPSGRGYALVASDGGIFTFGDAHFYGSMGGRALAGKSIVGMVATPNGKGYWLSASGTLSAPQLARELLDNPNVTENGAFVRQDLEAAAAGAPGSAGAPVDPTILRVLVTLAQSHRISISAIESGGRGHAARSRHFTGQAVDINGLDGMHVDGRNAPAITIIETVKGMLPPGSRFGQPNCGPTPPLPAGVSTIADSCNHLHIDVP